MNKRLLLIIFIALVQLKNYSQDKTSARVIYKMYKPVKEKKESKTTNPDVKLILDEMNKGYDLIECELLCYKNKSVFKLIDKMEFEGNESYKMVSIFATGKYFKDNEQKIKYKVTNFHGQTFTIDLPYDEYKWEISTETKVISGYKCFKATSKYELFNPRTKLVDIFYPEVWFTPEIPLSFGPRGLDGLPGLVLEGKFSDTACFYATDIDFKYDVKISDPVEGKKISFQEYQEILKKSYEQRPN